MAKQDIRVRVIGLTVFNDGSIGYTRSSRWLTKTTGGNSSESSLHKDVKIADFFSTLKESFSTDDDYDKYLVIYVDNTCTDKETKIRDILEGINRNNLTSHKPKLVTFGKETESLSQEITNQLPNIINKPDEFKDGITRTEIENLVAQESSDIFDSIKSSQQPSNSCSASFLCSVLTHADTPYIGVGLIILGLAVSAIIVSAWPLAISAAGVALVGAYAFFPRRQLSQNTSDDIRLQNDPANLPMIS